MPSRANNVLARLSVLDTVTDAFALAAAHLPMLTGRMIGPFIAGQALIIFIEAFARVQFGLPLPDLAKDIIWAPFGAIILIAMINFLQNEFNSPRWFHWDWPPCAPAVTVAVAASIASTFLLEELLRSAQVWIYESLDNRNYSMSQIEHEESMLYEKRLIYLAYITVGLAECAAAIATLGLIPRIMKTGRIDFLRSMRAIIWQAREIFLISAFCGLIFAAVDWLHDWVFSKLGISPYFVWDIGSNWRQNVNEQVFLILIWLPRTILRLCVTACLLAILCAKLSKFEERSVDHGCVRS